MYGQPWYSGYPTYPANPGFNPYIHPAYARGPAPRSIPSMRAVPDDRARALAERRARRARYLPDEDDDMEDYDFWPSQWGPSPQHAELAAKARQEDLERLQREEEARRLEQEELRQRQIEQLRRRQEEEALRRQEEYKRLQEEAARKQVEDERRRQAALEQQQRRREELARKYLEEQEARQRMIEEQKNLIRLRREEEARRFAAAEEERRSRFAEQQERERAASRSQSRVRPSASQEDNSIPIHFHRSTAQQSPPTSAPASPKSTHTLEEKEEAASRIQKQFRIHRTYRKLSDLRTEFEALKTGFTYPHLIDFEKPGAEDGNVLGVGAYRVPSDLNKDDEESMDVDSVPEGKLAYTSTNYALHLYSDQLDKLLMRLDGIESYGEKAIREERRAAVKAIEKEASKLDRYCKQTWLDYVEKQRQASKPTEASASQPTSQPTEESPEPVPSASPSTSSASDDSSDQPLTETVSSAMDTDVTSNPPSADEPSPATVDDDEPKPADAVSGRAEEAGDTQAEPEQEHPSGSPATTSAL